MILGVHTRKLSRGVRLQIGVLIPSFVLTRCEDVGCEGLKWRQTLEIDEDLWVEEEQMQKYFHKIISCAVYRP